jgi:predicted membrane-bound spermidine synthase
VRELIVDVKKFSLISTAIGLILSLTGVILYSFVGMADEGLLIMSVGFLIFGGGVSAYLYTRTTTIGPKIFLCGFVIAMTSLVVGNLVGMEHPLVIIFSKAGMWIAFAGAVINIISAVRTTKH